MGVDVHEKKRQQGKGDPNPSAGRRSVNYYGDLRSRRIVAWRKLRALRRRMNDHREKNRS